MYLIGNWAIHQFQYEIHNYLRNNGSGSGSGDDGGVCDVFYDYYDWTSRSMAW